MTRNDQREQRTVQYLVDAGIPEAMAIEMARAEQAARTTPNTVSDMLKAIRAEHGPDDELERDCGD